MRKYAKILDVFVWKREDNPGFTIRTKHGDVGISASPLGTMMIRTMLGHHLSKGIMGKTINDMAEYLPGKFVSYRGVKDMVWEGTIYKRLC